MPRPIAREKGCASSRITSVSRLDDPVLTRRLKDVRHRLDRAIRAFDAELLIGSRYTTGDVGTHIMTPSEQVRENPRAVLSANLKRTAEAIRSLEEYSKLVDVWVSGRFEVLRYDVYTLEKLILNAVAAHRTFAEVRLYVLVGGLPTLGDLTWVVGEALAGGADTIQLREKGLPDRVLLSRAREVRILTAQAKARFILNDRPDLARLYGADGVHLGQEDITTRDARRILGPKGRDRPVHPRADPDREGRSRWRAISESAPCSRARPRNSTTMSAWDSSGKAAEMTTLPWFAIGGIGLENLEDVLEAGARRVAVAAAIVRAERPRDAAREFRAILDTAG